MNSEPFAGFPGIAQATAIPNLFFVGVLPRMRGANELLAFLWLARVVQSQKGEARFASAEQIWAFEGAQESIEALGGGFDGLERGLAACVELGALLGLRLSGPDGDESVYLVNNPPSRRIAGKARAGDIELKPGARALPVATEPRPTIFRLYEENIGTITPIVGERLLEAVEAYPYSWIEEAFRTAVEMNVRNWRYIERILVRWAEEGRDEATAGDSLEDRKRRYLGGELGHLVNRR